MASPLQPVGTLLGLPASVGSSCKPPVMVAVASLPSRPPCRCGQDGVPDASLETSWVCEWAPSTAGATLTLRGQSQPGGLETPGPQSAPPRSRPPSAIRGRKGG